MKVKIFIILTVLIFSSSIYSQVHKYLPDAFSETVTSNQPAYKVSKFASISFWDKIRMSIQC